MRTRRILTPRSWLALAALCGVAFAVLFLATATTRATKAICGSDRGQTVVANRSARVYRIVAGELLGSTVYDYYGCAAGHAAPELLASTKSYSRVLVHLKLRGVVVGVDVASLGTDDDSDTLTVRSLANGHLLHIVHTNRAVGYGDALDAYALAPSGNIAWAITTSVGFGPGVKVVISRAIGDTITTLDMGPETRVRATSLRLRGRTVEWIDGGELRHANLP